MLTMSALAAFHEGQFEIILDRKACRGGIDGPGSIQITGEDFGSKTIVIRPLWFARGNLPPYHIHQMFRYSFEFSNLQFVYQDFKVKEENRVIIIETEDGQIVKLIPPGHKDCINMHEILRAA